MAVADSSWTQRIRDPVHGLVVFGDHGDRERDETDRIAWNLLNTPEFQRLRRIRQLGFSDLVFPGATHSRFAHSIGVYHMARRLADVIARRMGDERNVDRERIALLAALLHDIGHGPFSHAFEAVAKALKRPRRHEAWSAEIVLGDTQVNRVLRDADEDLPERVGAVLDDTEPKDIYSAIVSSQFDADRLDYIQRDRLMTGVEFGHIDRDWLLDCLRVGTVTVGRHDPVETPCLYLGPKGIQVAEEYLEARFRLYRMVYMHKTTRAAEKMLETLLQRAVEWMREECSSPRDPVLRYFAADEPLLGAYLDLDDAAVWAAMTVCSEWKHAPIAGLAQRLRGRSLYKCVEVRSRSGKDGNLWLRFRRKLDERAPAWRDEVLFDDAAVSSYKWYPFDDSSALGKVLVKTHDDMIEPEDIVDVSDTVRVLRDNGERIQRVYAPDTERAEELRAVLKEAEG